MALHPAARRTILAALAALVLTAAPAYAADPVFPLNSRVGLVPPPGFTPSTKFSGFENAAASAAILLVAMPGEAYAELEKSFTEEMLKQRGITVTARETMTFRDGRGVLVSGPKDGDGMKRHESVLIASTGGITALVSVQMIEASRATITEAVVREALKTVAVRPQIPDSEKLAVLPYKINNLAGFRIIRTVYDGTAILTQGPKDSAEAVEQPFLLIAVATGEVPKPEERDSYARRMFGTAPGIRDVKIVRAEPLRIGQTPGFEIVAEAKDTSSDTDVTAVQWLRFGQSGHLQMFGIARRAAWNEVYPKLRAIRDNIELR